MEKIKFIDSNETIYNVNIRKVKDNVIKITSEFPIDSNISTLGFNVLHESRLIPIGDYSTYTTKYKDSENELELYLSTGEVYVEPTIETPDIPIIPYIPTLEEIKSSKIKELDAICNQFIVNGVDVEIDGVIEHFSYNDEDQVNIKELFDLAIQTNVPLYYHADNKSCKSYTVNQVIEIYATATTNKLHHITYFNQIKMYIETLKDSDEVSAVTYGQELTGEYLDTYNASMKQSKLVLETLLAKRTSELSAE